jgi:hypothetical protein
LAVMVVLFLQALVAGLSAVPLGFFDGSGGE